MDSMQFFNRLGDDEQEAHRLRLVSDFGSIFRQRQRARLE